VSSLLVDDQWVSFDRSAGEWLCIADFTWRARHRWQGTATYPQQYPHRAHSGDTWLRPMMARHARADAVALRFAGSDPSR